MFRFTSPYEDEPSLSLYTGLARTLSRHPRLQCRYGPVSSLNLETAILQLPDAYRSAGNTERRLLERAEVYLRAAGSARLTNFAALRGARREFAACKAPRLAWQWLLTVEDARLMFVLSQERPGIGRLFAKRMAFHRRRVVRQAAWSLRNRGRIDSAEGIYLELFGNLLAQGKGSCSALSGDTEVAARWAAEGLRAAMAGRSVTDLTDVWFDLAWDAAEGGITPDASSGFSRSRNALREGKEADGASKQRVEIWTQPRHDEKGVLLKGPSSATNQAAPASRGGRLGEDEVETVGRTASSRMSGPPRRSHVRGEHEGHVKGHTHMQGDGSDQMYTIRERDYVPPTTEAEEWLRSVRRAQAGERRRLQTLLAKYLERRRAWRGSLSRHGRALKNVERVTFEPYPRVLARKDQPAARDTAVQILLDVSGSMEPYLQACKEAIVMLGDVLRVLGAKFGVAAYWEDDAPMGASALETVIWDVVPFHKSHDPAALAAVWALKPELDNRDGAAIRHVAWRLARFAKATKWMLVVSDARPAAEGYVGAYEDTRRAVAEARARGIQVVHLVVASEVDAALVDAVRYLYGHAFAVARSPKDLPLAMERALKQILRGAVPELR
ncbi:nitric oxide reductase [Alicyclobacillus mali]|uniref:Nitric oxide reductase n=1 Tax=Alicyclobacillus mali (ex Roth et al. 2021) TaxID=1123961 RepID=A0ABS0F2K4_9BACL|nr:nitric oxide reductase [Alicyclobacillus mali (ex Roth et al. 2021)]MBF8377476.1 nitric oxide reductase [Alicyclobacillus mali (ex Roth et al. 2021)]MCL6489395.1 nitric oxide reductase [Alicyclobacillus mali (ex Roth et al. 2021)]